MFQVTGWWLARRLKSIINTFTFLFYMGIGLNCADSPWMETHKVLWTCATKTGRQLLCFTTIKRYRVTYAMKVSLRKIRFFVIFIDFIDGIFKKKKLIFGQCKSQIKEIFCQWYLYNISPTAPNTWFIGMGLTVVLLTAACRALCFWSSSLTVAFTRTPWYTLGLSVPGELIRCYQSVYKRIYAATSTPSHNCNIKVM